MTKSKIMTIISAVAVLLVVVLTIGLIVSLVPKKDDKSNNAENIAGKVETMSLQNVAFFDNGISGYSVQPMAASVASEEQVVNGDSTTITLKLTSSVLSEVMLEKVNVPVKWSLEFVNPNSTWASGKNVTDYVKIQPKSDFTRTVTLTNLAPFGEQIKLTATMDSDSDKTASCTIDYVKRLSGGLQTIYCFTDFGDDLYAGGQNYSPTEEVGTITGTVTNDSTYVSVESGFVTLLQSYLKFDITVVGYSFTGKLKSEVAYNPSGKYYYVDITAVDDKGEAITCDYSHFVKNWSSLTEAQKTAVKYAWWKAYQTYGNNITIEVLLNYEYGGQRLGFIDGGSRTSYLSGECYGDVAVDGSLVNIVF